MTLSTVAKQTATYGPVAAYLGVPLIFLGEQVDKNLFAYADFYKEVYGCDLQFLTYEEWDDSACAFLRVHALKNDIKFMEDSQ